MKDLSKSDRELCSLQAKIFEASLNLSKSSSGVFIRRYMKSDVARRLDAGGFLFEATSVEDAIAEVEETYRGKQYGTKKYTREEMHWMGYFYRCWCCLTGDSSRTVYSTIGARELRGLYYPYHSLDTRQAVERVMEAKGLLGQSQIERGVALLKKFRGLA